MSLAFITRFQRCKSLQRFLLPSLNNIDSQNNFSLSSMRYDGVVQHVVGNAYFYTLYAPYILADRSQLFSHIFKIIQVRPIHSTYLESFLLLQVFQLIGRFSGPTFLT